MERLRAKREFQRVFSSGRRVQNSWAALMVRPREGVGVRLGFSVGRRFGGAVKRNRLRRRLREAARLALAEGRVVGGWDVVCLPRTRTAPADFAALRAALSELFQLAGITEKNS